MVCFRQWLWKCNDHRWVMLCVMVSQKSQNHRKVWVEGHVDVVVKNLEQTMPFNFCDTHHFGYLHFTKDSKQNWLSKWTDQSKTSQEIWNCFISASDTSGKFSSSFKWVFFRKNESSNNLQGMKKLMVNCSEICHTIPCLLCSKGFNFCLHWVL